MLLIDLFEAPQNSAIPDATKVSALMKKCLPGSVVGSPTTTYTNTPTGSIPGLQYQIRTKQGDYTAKISKYSGQRIIQSQIGAMADTVLKSIIGTSPVHIFNLKNKGRITAFVANTGIQGENYYIELMSAKTNKYGVIQKPKISRKPIDRQFHSGATVQGKKYLSPTNAKIAAIKVDTTLTPAQKKRAIAKAIALDTYNSFERGLRIGGVANAAKGAANIPGNLANHYLSGSGLTHPY